MNKKIILIFLSLLLIVFFISVNGYRLTDENKLNCKDCNVILITLTNLRYDHISTNGYFRQTTPNLDNLAKESLVFDSAFSHSSWTLPEGISIFSSLYPYQHGVMNRFDGGVLSKNTDTLIDVFNSNGYKTAGFTGGFDYDPRFGLTSRYDEYQDCKDRDGEGLTTLGYGRLSCTIPKALTWIKNNIRSKFFVHIQGYDVHCPFSQEGGKIYDKNYTGNVDFKNCLWTFDKSEPVIKYNKKYYPVFSSESGEQKTILLSEEDVKHLIALYDESITKSDKLIGGLLKELKQAGLDKKTIIVFTSEHGDMFGKDGRFMRGGPLRGTFYDDVLHTPLFMKIPGVKPLRFKELVEQIDIAPTLLGILSLKGGGGFQGKSLNPIIKKNEEIHQFVFAGSEYHPGLDNVYFNESTRTESIRNHNWKLIKETVLSKNPQSTVELYNLLSDKEETNNVTGLNREIKIMLEQKLSDWSKTFLKQK